MATDSGKNWLERKPGIPFKGFRKELADAIGIDNAENKLFVVIQPTVNPGPDGWEDQAEEEAKKAALKPLLSESGKKPIDDAAEVELAKTIIIDHPPLISDGRPNSYPLVLCSLVFEEEFVAGNYELTFSDEFALPIDPDGELLTDIFEMEGWVPPPPMPGAKDLIRFSSFIEFSRRVEVLALKFEDYDSQVKDSGSVYMGPAETYVGKGIAYWQYDFSYEAEALRDFYLEIWEFLKKNGVKASEPFAIVTNAEPWAGGYEEADTMDDDNLVDVWLNPAIAAPIRIATKHPGGGPNAPVYMKLPLGNEVFSIPLFTDARRLWLIRRVIESTGQAAPFLDFDPELEGARLATTAAGEVASFDPNNIEFFCKSPAFQDLVPNFPHDEFVKKFLRPKPEFVPGELATGGNPGFWRKAEAAVVQSEKMWSDVKSVGSEIQNLYEQASYDNFLKEVVQNRRKGLNEYLGDYFMGVLPTAPAKIHSLHDLYRYVLARMDIPVLIEEWLLCQMAALGLSLEDLLDMACEAMLEQFYELIETDAEKANEFAVFLDSGTYIPGTIGGVDVADLVPINITDFAHAIRNWAEDWYAGQLAEDLQEIPFTETPSGISEETAQGIKQALNASFSGQSWEKFLCNAILAASHILGKAIVAGVEWIIERFDDDKEQEETDPIPPYKKCDITFDTLLEVTDLAVGTLYDIAYRRAKKKINDEIIEWVEKEIVEKFRTYLWSWKDDCIDNVGNEAFDYGDRTLADAPSLNTDGLKKLFGEDFDFEAFLNSLFAGLTPQELCRLLKGIPPSDRVARYVVQFVQNYPNVPDKIKLMVDYESKVVPFFGYVGGYLDKESICAPTDHPENIAVDCTDLDYQYAEQAYRASLEKIGLSQESIEKQVNAQGSKISADLKTAFKALSDDTATRTKNLEDHIKETAAQAVKDVMTDEQGAQNISLNTVLELVKTSFRAELGNFYTLITSDVEMFEEFYFKISHLVDDQILFGGNQPSSFYDTTEHDVSKYHNFSLKVDVGGLVELPEDRYQPHIVCEEIRRQKNLMTEMMNSAGWLRAPNNVAIASNSKEAHINNPCPSPSGQGVIDEPCSDEPVSAFVSGESYRLAKGKKMRQWPPVYYDFPSPMQRFLKLHGEKVGVYGTYSVSEYFQGHKASGKIFPNMYDPANVLNRDSTNYWANFSAAQLDDLFRIAFRYYARYSYNYKFDPLSKGNYHKDYKYGYPKAEGLVLHPKFESDDLEGFYGYSSFLIDPVSLTDFEVAEYMQYVDFRSGHHGPGVTPRLNKMEGEGWVGWHEILTTLHQIAPHGIPQFYRDVLEVKLGYAPDMPWGVYGGWGWNIESSKECLLRLFLLRFTLDTGFHFARGDTHGVGYSDEEGDNELSTETDSNSEVTFMHEYHNHGNCDDWTICKMQGDYSTALAQGASSYHWHEQNGIAFYPSLGPKEEDASLDHFSGTNNEFDPGDYAGNLLGGHMERALTYYMDGLDFHPGYLYFPYGGQFVLSETQNDDNYDGPFHVQNLNEWKYNELAEDMWQSQIDKHTFSYAMGDAEDIVAGTKGAMKALFDELKTLNSAFPGPTKILMEEPNYGEIIDLFRNDTRPTLDVIIACREASMEVDYEGQLNFSLLPQREPELTEVEGDNTWCIIDRYAIKSTKGIGSTVDYEETTSLIGLVGKLQGEDTMDTSDLGRFKKIKEVFKDSKILNRVGDTATEKLVLGYIHAGPDLKAGVGGIYGEIPLQPQVFERYLVKKMTTSPIGFIPLVDPNTDRAETKSGWIARPDYDGETILDTVLLKLLASNKNSDYMLGGNQAMFQLYGVMFKHLIKQISSLISEDSDALSTAFQGYPNYQALQLNLTSIQDNAKKYLSKLIDKLDPMAGESPSMLELFYSVDKDGDGAIAARILIKIILIEYFIRALPITAVFNVEECLSDDLMINFLGSQIHSSIQAMYSKGTFEQYKDFDDITWKNIIKKVTKKVIETEMSDVVTLFKDFYKKQGFRSVIDQVILDNDEIYDLASMADGLMVWNANNLSALAESPVHCLGFPEPGQIFSPGSTFPEAIAELATWTNPRWSPAMDMPTYAQWWDDGQVMKPIHHPRDHEGFILERYVKIQFHSFELIRENLKALKNDNGNPLFQEEIVDNIALRIFYLPVEYKGDMRYGLKDKMIEGEPVYMSMSDFFRVYGDIFGDMVSAGGCSMFEWKQLPPPYGQKEEFDKRIEDAKKNFDFGPTDEYGMYDPSVMYDNYDSAVAATIQEELAFMEELCTLVPHPTEINEHPSDFANEQEGVKDEFLPPLGQLGRFGRLQWLDTYFLRELTPWKVTGSDSSVWDEWRTWAWIGSQSGGLTALLIALGGWKLTGAAVFASALLVSLYLAGEQLYNMISDCFGYTGPLSPCDGPDTPLATKATTNMPPGAPLPYSDLSKKNVYLYDGFYGYDVEKEVTSTPSTVHNEFISGRYYAGLNQLPLDHGCYVDYDKLHLTRPLAYRYLDHLNGSKVWANAQLVAKRESLLWSEYWRQNFLGIGLQDDGITEARVLTGAALLPLTIPGIFDFIDDNHRKLLTNIAFRYYTAGYFGDFTGFKFKDPHAMAATVTGRIVLNNIFKGQETTGIIQSFFHDGEKAPETTGDNFGGEDGLAVAMFPDEFDVRRSWTGEDIENSDGTFNDAPTWKVAPDVDGHEIPDNPTQGASMATFPSNGTFMKSKEDGNGLFFTDPWAMIEGKYLSSMAGELLQPPLVSFIWGQDAAEAMKSDSTDVKGFQTQEEFERYMLFGLLFGFDSGKKYSLIAAQDGFTVGMHAKPEKGFGGWIGNKISYQKSTSKMVWEDHIWHKAHYPNFADGNLYAWLSTNGTDFITTIDPPPADNTGGGAVFRAWTSSYQRDLFNAMQLYKSGWFNGNYLATIDETGIPASPMAIFTKGSPITDYIETKISYASGNEGFSDIKLEAFAKEFSYGVRLSYLLPEDTGDVSPLPYAAESPLSRNKDLPGYGYFLNSTAYDNDEFSFYAGIETWFPTQFLASGEPYIPQLTPDTDGGGMASKFELLNIKRVKSYYLRELTLPYEEWWKSAPDPGWDSYETMGYPPGAYSQGIFLFPLLEENFDATKKTVNYVLTKNWHTQNDYTSNTNSEHLFNEMKKKDEFKLLFDYLFPIKRVLALITAYSIKTFTDSGIVESIGTMFQNTKNFISNLPLPEDENLEE